MIIIPKVTNEITVLKSSKYSNRSFQIRATAAAGKGSNLFGWDKRKEYNSLKKRRYTVNFLLAHPSI